MTMNRIRLALTALTLMVGATVAMQAQAPPMGGMAMPAAGSAIDPAKSFDAAVTRLENLWMGAAQAMPADKYNFAIGGIKPDVDTKAIGDLKSKDEIVKALAATFAFAHKAVANVTDANAFLSIRGVQTPASAFAGAIGHAEDEYGQAVEYLRMNAIVPPASETKPKM
jgi:hypothetical protein